MICPHCKNETRGRDHNGRGVTCTFCMGRLALTHPEPEMVVIKEEPVMAKPKRKGRPRKAKVTTK